jgi:hypothetical protein
MRRRSFLKLACATLPILRVEAAASAHAFDEADFLSHRYNATKQRVDSRGVPPDEFLDQLIVWGRAAPEDIFAPNARKDVYTNVVRILGPWEGLVQRRASMLEIMRVLAGFESSWNWNAGRDVTNPSSVTPETIEAGAWQVSADSMNFGQEPSNSCTAECRHAGRK